MDAAEAPEFVTQIISRSVRSEKQAEYESWLQETLLPALREFEGFDGVTILRPGDTPGKDYVVIQRWRSYEALLRWVESDRREEVLAASLPLTHGGPRYQKETGLEVWFQLPGETSVRPPPRYKMALLIWMVLVPLNLLVGWLLGSQIDRLPHVAGAYVRAGLVVLLMTYFAMPWARRLLSGWLDR